MVCIKSGNLLKNILWLQWIAGTGAMLMMFTLGLIIGWTSPYLAQLTAPDSPLHVTKDEASWIASLPNLGRLFGAVIGGMNVHYFGSKRTLVLIGVPLMISWICIIVANSVIWLYGARLLAGLSMGMSYSSFPIYLGEVSSPTIRGALVSLAMTGIRFGTLIGNIMGAYVSMEVFSYVSLVPTVSFIILFLWIPQSPYHLVRLGKMEDAEKSITRYNPHVNSKVEVESIKDFITASGAITFQDRLREFGIPRNLKSGIIIAILYFFMQFSGLNTVIFYMEIILTTAKLTVVAPDTAVMIVGIVGVVAGWLSIYIADKFRRKVLMIASSAGVGVSMIALGTHFALLDNGIDPNVLQWLPLTAIILFEFFVCNGIIAVPNMVLSELFAPNIKNLAACLASIFLGLFGFLSAMSYQPAINAVGEAYVFWIHALLMGICIIFSVIFIPETKGKSLREIQDTLRK